MPYISVQGAFQFECAATTDIVSKRVANATGPGTPPENAQMDNAQNAPAPQCGALDTDSAGEWLRGIEAHATQSMVLFVTSATQSGAIIRLLGITGAKPC